MWRQWYYQTCNEFGWYQTSNQPGEEFGGDNIAPLELSENYCQDAYRGDEVRIMKKTLFTYITFL